MAAQVECAEIYSSTAHLGKNSEVLEAPTESTTPPAIPHESPLTEFVTANGAGESAVSCEQNKLGNSQAIPIVLETANGNDRNLPNLEVHPDHCPNPPPAHPPPRQSATPQSPDQEAQHHVTSNGPEPTPGRNLSAVSSPAHEPCSTARESMASAKEPDIAKADPPAGVSSQSHPPLLDSTTNAVDGRQVPELSTPPAYEFGENTVDQSVKNQAGSLTQVPSSHPDTLSTEHEPLELTASHLLSQPHQVDTSSVPQSPPRLSPSLSPLSSPRTSPLAHEDDPITSENQKVEGFNSSINQPQRLITSNPKSTLQADTPMTDSEPIIPGYPGSNMSKDQQRFAISVIKQLKRHRLAAPFVSPVDIVALNIPDYLLVIKNPMDLGTIETRLGKVGKPCFYRSVEQFAADVQLIFTNCYTYNGSPESSQYSRMALDLSIQFETQMKKMPSDEPGPLASSSRSPSLAKPLPKTTALSTAESISSPAISAKRKLESPADLHSQTYGQDSETHQRHSASPQLNRSKAPRTASSSTPANFNLGNHFDQHAGPSANRRASINTETNSNRGRRELKEKDYSHEIISAKAPEVTKSKAPTVTVKHIPNTKAELKFCKEVLRELNKKIYEKSVWPFYEPVDIVKLNIPDYPKIIKKPMDLSTMKQKLDGGEYSSAEAFADDFRLMLNNCFAFNPAGHPINSCGRQLESLFEAKWAERPPELIEVPVSQPEPSPPQSEAIEDIEALHDLQLKLDQLKAKISTKSSGSIQPTTNLIAGKKSSISRGASSAKLSNINTTNLPVSASLNSSIPKSAKSNGANSNKARTAAGARRKSTGQVSGAAKRQLQPHEQLIERQNEHRQQINQQKMMAASLDGSSTTVTLQKAKAAPVDDYFVKIDYEQKKDLATQIQNAVEPMQSDAINLIRNSRPDLVSADGEEIELDIDALDDRTLYQLYQLVCAPLLSSGPPPKKKKKSLPGNGKSKGLTKASGGPRKSHPPSARPAAQLQPPLSAGGLTAPNVGASSPNWPGSGAPTAHGNGNGVLPKHKGKKGRGGINGGGLNSRRKGLGGGANAEALIKDLEQKLHAFEKPSTTDQVNHMNGGANGNTISPVGPNSYPPPAGPIEYASSSSESDSESDEDSD